MYAGVSGLKAHMTKMDIVGNNIANVNTVGYKGSRATFKTMLSQTIQGASAPQDGRGGTNPQQVGLGVSLGSIDKDMGQGNTQSTGRNADLAIEGNGFFVVGNGGSNYYTRAGSTTFDRDGFLVNATNGYRIKGWMADVDGNIDTNGALEDITLKHSMDANATSEVTYSGNLDADAYDPALDYGDGSSGGAIPDKSTNPLAYAAYINNPNTRTTTLNACDSQGTLHTVNLSFAKTGANTWDYTVNSISGSSNIDSGDSGTLVFAPDGSLDTGLSTINNPLQFDSAGGASDDQKITLDFTSLTQYSGDMTADKNTVNGYQAGAIESYAFDSSGVITGYYDNGQRQTIGRLAVADFNNPAGLSQAGNTLFKTSNNSGQVKIGAPNSGSFGSLVPGTLEMSNIDLSRQFTEMITTQRGFQANSKVITTGDEILQELVNLKR